MNEGAKQLPWEKEAYDKTKHMKNKKKTSPAEMSSSELVLNDSQTHSKFLDKGAIFNAGMNDNSQPTSKAAKKAEDLAVPEKATPITLKSRRGYSSPLNYNSPLKIDPPKKNRTERKADPETGLVYDYMYKDTETTKNAETVPSAYDVDAVDYSGPKDPNIYKVLDKEIASGFAKSKYGYGGSDAHEYETHKNAYNNKSKAPAPTTAAKTSETTITTTSTRKPVNVTDPAKPGKLNAGFYETKNIRLAEKHDDKIRREKIRKAGKEYVRNAKIFGEDVVNAKGDKVEGKQLRTLKRRGINPETAQPFTDSKDMLEYGKKFKRTNQQLINKRGPGEAKSSHQMTEQELQADKDKRSTNNVGPIKGGYKFTAETTSAAEYNATNKNKSAFKMNGYGSKLTKK
jgi:hypothetical protein